MKPLNLPVYDYKLRKSGHKTLIYDVIRLKYVVLTPEEWVRQHFLHYLLDYLHYPRSLISIERGTVYNTLQKRTDLRVYGPAGYPLLLVECKATTVPVTAATVNQAIIYNRVIRAPYLALTNGLEHFCWRVDPETEAVYSLDQIPDYKILMEGNSI